MLEVLKAFVLKDLLYVVYLPKIMISELKDESKFNLEQLCCGENVCLQDSI
jgi:hypothetical protein